MAKRQIVNSYKEVLQELSIRMGKIVTPHDLFEVGLTQIKRIDNGSIRVRWKELVDSIQNPYSKIDISVRSHGRNGSGSNDLLVILKKVFEKDFKIDSTNNAAPAQILRNAFNEEYQDYQISHVFEERTNNPLLFTAPWMICYTPKIIDPFTGHETKGFPEFKEEFIDWAFRANKVYIDEYNEIIFQYWKKLKSVLNTTTHDKKFKDHMVAVLAPIHKNAEKLSKTDRMNYYLTEFEKI